MYATERHSSKIAHQIFRPYNPDIQDLSDDETGGNVAGGASSSRLYDKEFDPVTFVVTKVEPMDLANQLTLLDLPIFQAIRPEELTTCGWNKKDKLTISPNVVAMTRRFNLVCFWAQKEILDRRKTKLRAEVLVHFIRIAKKLHDLNNLHACFAIIAALQSSPIFRLNKTWALIPSAHKSSYDKLTRLFSDDNNWERLRKYLTAVKLPCIPYLGLYLTDLIYIDVAHPSSGGLDPSQRTTQMNNILRVLADFQQSSYDKICVRVPCIQQYLQSMTYIDELQKFLEDDLYKLSHEVEPEESSANTPVTNSSKQQQLSVSIGSGSHLLLEQQQQNGNNSNSNSHNQLPHSRSHSTGGCSKSLGRRESHPVASSTPHRLPSSASKAAAAKPPSSYSACQSPAGVRPPSGASHKLQKLVPKTGSLTPSGHEKHPAFRQSHRKSQSLGSTAQQMAVFGVSNLCGPTMEDDEIICGGGGVGGVTKIINHSHPHHHPRGNNPHHIHQRSLLDDSLLDVNAAVTNASVVCCQHHHPHHHNHPDSSCTNSTLSFLGEDIDDSGAESGTDHHNQLQLKGSGDGQLGCSAPSILVPLPPPSSLVESAATSPSSSILVGDGAVVVVDAGGLDQFTHEGFVKRKTMLKDGKRPTFKRSPSKMLSISGWMVVMGEDPLNPDSFQLQEPHRGIVYKFRCGSQLKALEWVKHLKEASERYKEKIPPNLMSFDD